jgi:hypothetical protein
VFFIDRRKLADDLHLRLAVQSAPLQQNSFQQPNFRLRVASPFQMFARPRNVETLAHVC